MNVKRTDSRAVQRVSDNWMPICFAVMGVALVIAAILDAALTWDGAYYLFSMVDSGEPFVAHGREADRLYHWPVVWILTLRDNLAAARVTFGLMHVATPLLSLLGSWWVVRRADPYLIIWPMLTIGLVLLPGQINFISEGIKANQLLWPLLLSILIGLPRRTIPLSLVTGILIFYLHPVAVPIFAACALAAIVVSRVRGTNHRQLLATAAVLLAVAILRYRQIAAGYEGSEMTWSTQQRQWENAALGAPMWAISAAGIIALVLMVAAFIPPTAWRWLRWMLALVAMISFIPMLDWAQHAETWWQGLEYRGPAFAVSMVAAGAAFLSVVLPARRREHRHPPLTAIGPLACTLALGFAAVIIVQSFTWRSTISAMNTHIEQSDQACVARERLPGMPESPLNLWSTNALSLLFQSQEPTKISMTAEQCRVNLTTGHVFIAPSWRPHQSQRMDFTGLEPNLAEAPVCYWRETDGWYPRESLNDDRWRWTENAGTVVVTVPADGTVLLSGDVVTQRTPNTVDIVVNGTRVQTVLLEEHPYRMITGIQVPVRAGDNEIVFRSHGIATSPGGGDDRLLAISLWNLEVYWGEDSTPCSLTVDP